jgi:hypothetical protein
MGIFLRSKTNRECEWRPEWMGRGVHSLVEPNPMERGCVVFDQPQHAGNFLCFGAANALRLVSDTAALRHRRKYEFIALRRTTAR